MRQLMLESTMASLGPIPDEAVEHGEVFTRPWIVDLILDLAGYSSDLDLADKVAVEPACGAGAFLGPMVVRLSQSCRAHGRNIAEADSAIRAYDLLTANVHATRRMVEKLLVEDEWPMEDAAALAERWVHEGDYLLDPRADPADFVIGNPPYIRLEDVPPDRMAAYRVACRSMIGRADIYVGFFEVGLRSLRPGGVLAFICADRWMRNQYGRDLRQLVASSYSMDVAITMHDVDAFEEQVSAYPAVTVIRRGQQGSAVVADTTRAFGREAATSLSAWISSRSADPQRSDAYQAARLPRWFKDGDSWPAGSPALLALVEDLNERFPLLQDPNTGTRVGIGVATGADAVFVTKGADVEPDRLLPLSMVRDTSSGRLTWSEHFLVDPWDADGKLVDLSKYPRLRAYFESHRSVLTRRHIAGKRPSDWYRTIDKVDHSLTNRPKLLFPDMKMSIHPVLDELSLYPHHNLYYVVSDSWDMRVLGGLLLSRVAQAFIEAYAVRMRGGTLRFQAQYLRRIRVPDPASISPGDRDTLASAFDRRDADAATKAALRVYRLDGWTGDLGNGSTGVRGSGT